MPPSSAQIRQGFDSNDVNHGSTSTSTAARKRQQRSSSSSSTKHDKVLCWNPLSCIHRYWVYGTHCFRRALTGSVVFFAKCAATYPWLTIVTLLALSIATMAAGLYTNFTIISDFIDLFTPVTSLTIGQRVWAHRDSRLPGGVMRYLPIQMIVHAEGHNVLEYEGVERMFQVLDLATNDIITDGLDDVCLNDTQAILINGKVEKCDLHGVTRFWNQSRAWFDRQVPPNDDMTRFIVNTTYPDGTTVDRPRIFGMIQVQEDGIPLSAEAMFLEISIPISRIGSLTGTKADQLRKYTSQLEDAITDLRNSWKAESPPTKYRVEFAIEFNVGKEFQEAIFSDFPLLPFVVIIMLLFTCLVFWRCDRIKSRTLLAVGSVVTVLLSLATGFGLMFILGVPYTLVTNVLPYIAFGVGLDDTYIIVGAFTRRDSSQPIMDRIHDTFEEVGLSIFMTSLTTALAFMLGCVSSVPAIQYICLYGFPAILIDFFYQVTFFVALLVLDERRIQTKRLDCCLCFVSNREDGNDDIANKDNTNDNVAAGRGRKNIMGWYSDQLLRPSVKIGILIGFAALFAGCAYSATLLKQDFSFYDLLPDYSPTKTYLEAKENYGGINGEIYIYFRGLNQSDSAVQYEMIDFIDQIAAIDHVELQPFCWVRDMRALLDDNKSFLQSLTENPTTARVIEDNPELVVLFDQNASLMKNLTFNQALDLLLSHPLAQILYAPHLNRDDVTGDVHASRCQVMIRNLEYTSVKASVDLLHAQNAVTLSHPINENTNGEYHAFLYKDLFHLWEFFEVAIDELKFTAFTSIAVVSIFGVLFVPHWSAILYIFPFMCLLYVNLLGAFQIAGLSINVLTYVVLVVSIGLLVDFIMHILLRFFESQKGTRQEKVKDTLETMGTSVLLGGVSTFLGTIPLMFSQSMVFRTICTAFFSMIALGVTHGLILLPAVLSIFGATSTSTDNSNQNRESSNSKDQLINSPSLASFMKTRDDTPVLSKHGHSDDRTTSGSSGTSSGQIKDSPTPTIQRKRRRGNQRNPHDSTDSTYSTDQDIEDDRERSCTVTHLCLSTDTFEQFEIVAPP